MNLQKRINRTASGQPILYRDPSQTKIVEQDIYLGLKNECRYNGQLEVPVLFHTALCCVLDSQHNIRSVHVALHDMHEAYVKDIPAGLKDCLPDYQIIEKLWHDYVHHCFGITPDDKDVYVKYIDIRALCVEMWVGLWGDWEPAQIVANKFGGCPTKQELKLYQEILNKSPQEQWTDILNVIKTNGGKIPWENK